MSFFVRQILPVLIGGAAFVLLAGLVVVLLSVFASKVEDRSHVIEEQTPTTEPLEREWKEPVGSAV